MRLPRFSLQTMFIGVTILCLWLGYYVYWIHERQLGRTWLAEHSISFGSYISVVEPHPGLSWGLMLLGEKPLDSPHWVEASESEKNDLTEYHSQVAKIIVLFPESQIEDGDVPAKN